MLRASDKARTSIAFFADPDKDVSRLVRSVDVGAHGGAGEMTVAEYIMWRSGGTGDDRSGVAFVREEEERLGGGK